MSGTSNCCPEETEDSVHDITVVNLNTNKVCRTESDSPLIELSMLLVPFTVLFPIVLLCSVLIE